MNFDVAEALSKRVLIGIFPALPRSGLHNHDWAGQVVKVDDRRFYVAIAPWSETYSGRQFHFWPTDSTPASRLAVQGVLTISESGLRVEPQRFFGAKKWRKESTG